MEDEESLHSLTWNLAYETNSKNTCATKRMSDRRLVSLFTFDSYRALLYDEEPFSSLSSPSIEMKRNEAAVKT